MRKRILGFVFICLAVTLGASTFNTVQASGPDGVFESRFFIPNKEIVSCTSPRARSRCADNTCSTSTGQGTCSHHGGVVGVVDHSSSTSSVEPPVALPPEPIAEAPPPLPEPPSKSEVSPAQIPQSGGVLISEHNSNLFMLGVFVLVITIGYGVQMSIKEE